MVFSFYSCTCLQKCSGGKKVGKDVMFFFHSSKTSEGGDLLYTVSPWDSLRPLQRAGLQSWISMSPWAVFLAFPWLPPSASSPHFSTAVSSPGKWILPALPVGLLALVVLIFPTQWLPVSSQRREGLLGARRSKEQTSIFDLKRPWNPFKKWGKGTHFL